MEKKILVKKESSIRMVKSRRGWHNPAKENKPSTEGRCKFCHRLVQNLEAHTRAKHKCEKSK